MLETNLKCCGDGVTEFHDKEIPGLQSCMFSSFQVGFCSQERWKLLSASAFKRM